MVADRKGRKLVIMAGLSGFAVFTVMFGFSVNFAMALASRIVTGMFDGK